MHGVVENHLAIERQVAIEVKVGGRELLKVNLVAAGCNDRFDTLGAHLVKGVAGALRDGLKRVGV